MNSFYSDPKYWTPNIGTLYLENGTRKNFSFPYSAVHNTQGDFSRLEKPLSRSGPSTVKYR